MTTTPIRASRALIAIVALAAGATMVSPTSVSAAQRSADPYSAWQSVSNTCQPGSECSGSATASGDGTQSVAASVTRRDPTLDNEYWFSHARGSVVTRAPEGSKPLRVAFTWRVDSANTAANSTTLGGIAVGRIFAEGQVLSCKSCTVVEDTDGHGITVASTYSTFGPVPPEKVATAGSLVTHTITVNGPDGAPLKAGTRLTLAGTSRAFAYVGGPCYPDGCDTASHSGTASANADLQLTSIALSRGAETEEPVLIRL